MHSPIKFRNKIYLASQIKISSVVALLRIFSAYIKHCSTENVKGDSNLKVYICMVIKTLNWGLCHVTFFMWKDERREIISSALVMPIPTSAQNYESLKSPKENSFPVLNMIFLTQCFHVEYGDELQSVLPYWF